jgi:hypothetical protein
MSVNTTTGNGLIRTSDFHNGVTGDVYTVLVWFYPTEELPDWNPIVGWDGSDYIAILESGAATRRLVIAGANYPASTSPLNQYTLNAWNLVALVSRSTTDRRVVLNDGTEVTDTTFQFTETFGSFYVAYAISAFSSTPALRVAEVAIINGTALTEAQVNAIYSGATSYEAYSPTDWWKLEDATLPCANSGSNTTTLEQVGDGSITLGDGHPVSYAPATLPPEILVEYNGTEVEDGDTSAEVAGLDFGSVDKMTGTVERIFSITNSGEDDLVLDGDPYVALSGTNADQFSIIVQPSGTIPQGDTSDFTVEFDPDTAGEKNAWVVIQNNSDVNPFTFAINGTGTELDPPEARITYEEEVIGHENTSADVSGLDFGTVGVGNSASRTFGIENSGGYDLSLSGDPIVAISGTDADKFEVVTQPGTDTLNTNTSTSFTVTYTPDEGGEHVATVSIANNSDTNPFTFDINGTGVELAEITLDTATLNVNSNLFAEIADEEFEIENSGLATLDYAITANKTWVSFDPASGEIAPEGTEDIMVSIDSSGLAVGTHQATITVTDAAASNSPQTIVLTVVVTDPNAFLYQKPNNVSIITFPNAQLWKRGQKGINKSNSYPNDNEVISKGKSTIKLPTTTDSNSYE